MPYFHSSNMTADELKKLFPRISNSCLRANTGGPTGTIPDHSKRFALEVVPMATPSPNTFPKSNAREALVEPTQAQGGGTGSAPSRIRVVFTLYRVALLDPDNKWASVKWLLDALRYADLIPNDRERDIELVVDQVRVRSYLHEGTKIDLTYP